jgi:hypothetical protein
MKLKPKSAGDKRGFVGSLIQKVRRSVVTGSSMFVRSRSARWGGGGDSIGYAGDHLNDMGSQGGGGQQGGLAETTRRTASCRASTNS